MGIQGSANYIRVAEDHFLLLGGDKVRPGMRKFVLFSFLFFSRFPKFRVMTLRLSTSFRLQARMKA